MLKMRNFQVQQTNNCANNEAENGTNLRTNLEHFESQKQITARRTMLNLKKQWKQI